MMKKISTIILFIVCFIFLSASKAKAADISAGDLIKASQPAVYYYGADGKRYVFPNEKTYQTWYADFSGVKIVTDAELAAIQIAGNVTYKPGVKMVKIQTDPKVYAVAHGGLLRWIKTEAAAAELYGINWAKKVEDVADAFFINYNVGANIEVASDFSIESEIAVATDINADKAIVKPTAPEPMPVVVEPVYTWSVKTANTDGYLHKNLILSSFGGGFLSTWNDDRNGQNEIYFQRMGSDGAASGNSQSVSLNITDSNNGKGVWDGVNLYFIWEDSSLDKRAIYWQKHDAEGNQFSKQVFASTTYATSKNPDIVWNGDLAEYGVAWWDSKTPLDNSSRGNVYFSRIIQGGTKIGSELILTQSPSLILQPRIIAAGDKFAVLWQGEDMTLKFALVNYLSELYGTVKDVYAAGEMVSAKIAWNGTNFGVVWPEKNDDNQDIYFIRLDASGNAIGSKIALTSGAGDATEPDIAWYGDKFYVVYASYKPNFSATSILSNINVIKIDGSGNAGQAKNISNSSAKVYSPSIAKNGSIISVAWLEDSGTANKILAAVESR